VLAEKEKPQKCCCESQQEEVLNRLDSKRRKTKQTGNIRHRHSDSQAYHE
jgi:hypothetical protein